MATVNIEPEAALRAITAENEFRRNRILILENDNLRMEREIEALTAKIEEMKVQLDPTAEEAEGATDGN